MDIQLVIVSLIVLAAGGYMVWRAKKARKGQCSCGCGGLWKELQAEDALSRSKEYIILGDTL